VNGKPLAFINCTVARERVLLALGAKQKKIKQERESEPNEND
jgi:hypothetical protein